jgi:molecular chaperone DnaK (HSP70)
VYATDGDDDLGGSDFDMCLNNAILGKLSSDHSLTSEHTDSLFADLSDGKSDDEVARMLHSELGTSPSQLCTTPSIRQKSEDVKKALTYNTTVEFTCDALLTTPPVEGSESVSSTTGLQVQTISLSVSKDYFESTCSELFARGLIPVTRLLDELAMQKSDIDEVVLVGGSTRIPLVKQQLR